MVFRTQLGEGLVADYSSQPFQRVMKMIDDR